MNDEGVGIHVVNRLKSEGVAGADCLDGGTGGYHLLGTIQSYKHVIMVDAALDDFPAGHIRVLRPRWSSDFPRQLSAHEIGLKDLIDAAVVLGNLPDIHLIAISVKDFQDLGTDLSEAVEGAVPEALKLVRGILRDLQEGP